MKIKNFNQLWYMVASGGALLLLLLVACVCPMSNGGVEAAECTDANPNACPTQVTTTRASVDVVTTIAVALTPDVEINVTPSATGEFSSQAAELTVSTNSAAGYSVIMTTTNGSDTLIGPTSSTAKVNPVAVGTEKSEFGNNTWGYHLALSGTDVLDDTIFDPVPKVATAIKTTAAASSDTYDLTFGAKIDTTLPSGEYSNEVIVSAIANPRKLNLNDITTMQAMTSDVCTNTAIGVSKQLTDVRDGKTYHVAKLKDNKCWMTQNLAYEFVKGTVLTSSDSDVLGDWTVPDNAKNIGVPGSDMDMWKGNNVISGHDSYGNYYTFAAATAGSGTGLGANQVASASVCPAGWRLLTGGTGGEYETLSNGLTKDTIKAAPYYIVTSGILNSDGKGGLLYAGNNGYYWSSTTDSDANSYGLAINPTGLYPSYTNGRGLGFAVRCIAK